MVLDGNSADVAKKLQLPGNAQPRWLALLALAKFFTDQDTENLDEAIRQFDLTLGDEGTKLVPHNYELDPLVKNFGWFKSSVGRKASGLILRTHWTPGTFIVYDYLKEIKKDGSNVSRAILNTVSESTPIVFAGNKVQNPGVVELVIDRLPGPIGLVTPDFFAMGQVDFIGLKQEDFLTSLQSTIRYAIRSTSNSKDRNSRFRWRIRRYRGGDLPISLKDRSAEAAAACCTHALLQYDKDSLRPLLDPDVGITGTVEALAHPDFDRTPVGRVHVGTIPDKRDGAQDAKLSCLVLSSGHISDHLSPHRGLRVNGRELERKETHIQHVSNLAEAYDALLITSAAVAAYKEKVCKAWEKEWDPQPTPVTYPDSTKAEGNA
jgi:hypothetical protein